jgi:hypothetical protein
MGLMNQKLVVQNMIMIIFHDFDDEGDTDEEDGGHEEGSHEKAADVGGASGSATMSGQMLDYDEEDEVSSNLARSDILVTRPKSDEYEASSWPKCVTRISQLQDVDMEDPHLDVGMSFESAAQFRKAVREYNLFRGKDVVLTKNDGDRVIGVCTSKAKGCPWRVYGSLVTGERIFMLKSLNPKHQCTRCYKSSIVTFKWIADKMINKFRT